MKLYSNDLRERLAATCHQAGRMIGEVAVQFSVLDSFVRELRRRQRTSGSLAASLSATRNELSLSRACS